MVTTAPSAPIARSSSPGEEGVPAGGQPCPGTAPSVTGGDGVRPGTPARRVTPAGARTLPLLPGQPAVPRCAAATAAAWAGTASGGSPSRRGRYPARPRRPMAAGACRGRPRKGRTHPVSPGNGRLVCESLPGRPRPRRALPARGARNNRGTGPSRSRGSPPPSRLAAQGPAQRVPGWFRPAPARRLTLPHA